jgi:hypothetical protein
VRVPVYNSIAEVTAGAEPIYRAAVISVHGMNTFGPWQKHINTTLQDNLIRHIPVDYGFQRIGPLRPFTGWLLRRVSEKIVAAYQDHMRRELMPSAIGHSFGTLSIGTALKWNPELILPRVVTFGSILPCDFPWRTLVDRGQVQAVLNELCPSDPWVRRAWLWITGAGASGCDGFSPEENFVEQREYQWTGHSLLGTQLHCEQVWVPFILGH